MFTGLSSRLPVGSVKAKRAFGRLMTFPTTSATIARTDTGQTFSGTNVFSNSLTVQNGVSTGMYVDNSTAYSVNFRAASSGVHSWSSTTTYTATADLFLGRNAAANLRQGATDAAAPVAQTLSVQSVVAGTSNTAGSNWTLKSSAGTGTGVGGDIVFQTAPAGASGTSQNACVDAFRIGGNLTCTLYGPLVHKSYTVATLPAGVLCMRTIVTDALAPAFGVAVAGGGAAVIPVYYDGAWKVG